MKKYLISPILILAFLSCQTENPTQHNLIIFGEKASLHSEVLDQDREIWVHVPASANDPENNHVKYPVVYLLDGDAHFYSVTGMIKQLSTVNGNTITPEMIVVGIPNVNRYKDLTPSHVGDSTNSSGGGQLFTDFIEKELIPFIDKEYQTGPYRTLIGHSLGGLIVINTLMNRPHLFDNYLAIDPSLWWDNQKLQKQALVKLEIGNFEDKSLFVGVANTMADGMDTANVVKDNTRATQHIRSILEFSKAAEKNDQNGLHFGWKYYNEEGHGSVPLMAEYDALNFLFSWTEFNGWDQIMNPTSNLSIQEKVDLIVTHYLNISAKFDYEVFPEERMINDAAYYVLNNGPKELAFELFNLNVQNYPESARVHDSMSDYYIAQSDTIKAVEFLNKALEIEEVDVTREKLEQLQAR